MTEVGAADRLGGRKVGLEIWPPPSLSITMHRSRF